MCDIIPPFGHQICDQQEFRSVASLIGGELCSMLIYGEALLSTKSIAVHLVEVWTWICLRIRQYVCIKVAVLSIISNKSAKCGQYCIVEPRTLYG